MSHLYTGISALPLNRFNYFFKKTQIKKIITGASFLILSNVFFAVTGLSQASIKDQVTSAAVTPFASTAAAPGISSVGAREFGNIHFKAIADFNKKYKKAADAKWYISGKLHVASFNDEGKHYTAVYHDNGKWLHTMINYNPAQLSDNIREIVEKKFSKYSITWVTEVHEGDMVSYFIKIQNEKRIKDLIVYDGQVAVHKTLIKAE